VLLVEGPARVKPATDSTTSDALSLQQPQLLNNG
jgi:hypothetical protein